MTVAQAIEVSSALPRGWIEVSLGDILSPSKERVNSFESAIESFIGLEHIESGTGRLIGRGVTSNLKSSKTRFRKGDLLYGRLRPYLNKVCVASFDGVCSTDILVFPSCDLIDNRYLGFFLSTTIFVGFANQNMSGVQHPRISFEKMATHPIPLAPLSEQNRIASKIEELFTKLDAGIESLKKAKLRLKRYRQSLLKAAFEGKLTEEWRKKHEDEIEPISQLLERIHSTRTNIKRRKEASEVERRGFFQLPDEWGWTTIGGIAEAMQYGTSEKASIDDSGIPVLRMGNIREGKIDFQNLRYMPANSSQLQNFILDDGDLLFNRTNSKELVGKSAIYRSSYPKAAFASYLIRVKPRREFYDPNILSYFINSNFGRLYINSVVSQQVGQANVNGTKLSTMPIPLLSISEQEVLLSEMQRSLSIADQTEKTIEYTIQVGNRLRQSILNQAFQGKLVPQDPNDEPPVKLLARIKREREIKADSAIQEKLIFGVESNDGLLNATISDSDR